ncbi:hypothetical protein W59_04391 [Rhodococcus opacus RKJ300 = JCM 13270]|uniref:Uncharacterized protein n=1 Tax=Rhodococcus opacus RKJ300 = JCM 13270 TaxID=1165867 RepID=I0WXH6_RHOOP|nr:hypothetical protein W59_04391 [Rhodococcus opacus RKJ300 = JCM 13270]
MAVVRRGHGDHVDAVLACGFPFRHLPVVAIRAIRRHTEAPGDPHRRCAVSPEDPRVQFVPVVEAHRVAVGLADVGTLSAADHARDQVQASLLAQLGSY